MEAPRRTRPATDADLDAIIEIERGSFTDPWSRRAFLSLFDNPRVRFTVVEEDERVLGYAIVWRVLDEAEIANLAVRPSERARGFGALLLDAAIRDARASGAVEMFLEVRDSNLAARALYCSRGFEEVGRRRRYYRRPVEDAVVMRCALDCAEVREAPQRK